MKKEKKEILKNKVDDLIDFAKNEDFTYEKTENLLFELSDELVDEDYKSLLDWARTDDGIDYIEKAMGEYNWRSANHDLFNLYALGQFLYYSEKVKEEFEKQWAKKGRTSNIIEEYK